MKKYLFTFGSGQLKNFNVAPQHIVVIVEAPDEISARQKVFKSKIGAGFCTSYPYSKLEEFKETYKVVEMTLEELLSREMSPRGTLVF